MFSMPRCFSVSPDISGNGHRHLDQALLALLRRHHNLFERAVALIRRKDRAGLRHSERRRSPHSRQQEFSISLSVSLRRGTSPCWAENSAAAPAGQMTKMPAVVRVSHQRRQRFRLAPAAARRHDARRRSEMAAVIVVFEQQCELPQIEWAACLAALALRRALAGR